MSRFTFRPPPESVGQSSFDQNKWLESKGDRPRRRRGLSSDQWDELIHWIMKNHRGKTISELRAQLRGEGIPGLMLVPEGVFIEASRHAGICPRSR